MKYTQVLVLLLVTGFMGTLANPQGYNIATDSTGQTSQGVSGVTESYSQNSGQNTQSSGAFGSQQSSGSFGGQGGSTGSGGGNLGGQNSQSSNGFGSQGAGGGSNIPGQNSQSSDGSQGGSGGSNFGGQSSQGSGSFGSQQQSTGDLGGQRGSGGSNLGGQTSQGSGNSGSQQQAAGTFGGPGGGGGSGGGNLNVECKRQEVSPGKFKFNCEGVNRDALSLRSEHILWLSSAGGQQQIVDIEIPNYKIEELIKAGFKSQPGQGSLINLLLKKPEQSYDAQVDLIPANGGTPTVNLNYEPVQKTLVHYPNDRPYSPLQGPILPPLAGGRPQRQVPAKQVLKGQRTYSVRHQLRNHK